MRRSKYKLEISLEDNSKFAGEELINTTMMENQKEIHNHLEEKMENFRKDISKKLEIAKNALGTKIYTN